MKNSTNTKQTIIRESANLFNTKGFKATSLSDITAATGFTKGAIYRHFKNKEDLEQQALKSLSTNMFNLLGKKIKEGKDYEEKMNIVFTFFQDYILKPPFVGGCPLMNSACESDDGSIALRQLSFGMLINLKSSVRRILQNGIRYGQVKTDTDVEEKVHLFIATLEGAIMMSKLEQNENAIKICIKFLKEHNKTIIL